MISVVCVYNDRAMMERILLPSLREQTAPHEEILIDNTHSRFSSAASALNYGTEQTRGKYIMFVHQDVELSSHTWLEDVEKVLDSLPYLGVAGVIGKDITGKLIGRICNAGMDEGQKIDIPTEVQTLDECVLIVPTNKFFGFDYDTFDGWHCYGADYCLTWGNWGFKSYALPTYIYHRSLITNTKDLWKHQAKLYWKHHKPVYTTAGSVSLPKAIATPLLIPMFKMYYHYRKDWIGKACKELADCETILDVGCGYNSPLQHLKKDGKKHHLTGIDAFHPYIVESQKKLLHDSYLETDLRTLEYPEKSFDGMFCSEVIEHLSKQEAHRLLWKMSRWAKKVVIVTTPNGYVLQHDPANPYQEHKSGWTIRELRKFGFTEVKGMSGLKCLRNERAEVRFRPLYLWAALSIASQVLTEFLPSLAFQLLAIKRISG